MKATLTRNIGPIVLFLIIVAAGMVVMACWVLAIKDDGMPIRPHDRPSISQLGEAAPVRPLASPSRRPPAVTTGWPRTRVSDSYRLSTTPTVKASGYASTSSPPPSPLLGTSDPEIIKSRPPIDVSTTPTPDVTTSAVFVGSEE